MPGPRRQRFFGQRAKLGRRYEQGDLDGLCGVYVIVNAVAQLCPALTVTHCEQLFEVLMRAVRASDTRRKPAVTSGIDRRMLLTLLALALRHVRQRHRLTLKIFRPPRSLAKRWTLDTLWQLLHAQLGDECVAIIGLGGRRDHWTLATSITAHQIRLIDSDGLRVLNRKHCGTNCSSAHTIISHDMVLLVCQPRQDAEPD